MFKVKPVRGKHYTDVLWRKALEDCYWWELCFNSPDFIESVMNYKRSNTRSFSYKTAHADWFKPGDNAQVVATMLSGKEVLLPELDEEADVYLELGDKKGVLGWTNPKTLWQWTSKWFLKSSATSERVGNRVHEYMHKLGYAHPYKRTDDRPYSVPYAVGYLARDWVKKNYIKGKFKQL